MATERGTAAKAPTEAVRGLASQLPTDQLKAELLNYLKALGRSVVSSATDRLGSLGGKLPGLAKDKLPGMAKEVAGSVSGAAGGAGGVAGSVAKKVAGAGVSGVAEKVKDTLGGGGGGRGGGGGKVTNIVETIDVGVPVDVAYNQWTQFTDFPDFMKKVENVEQESETESQWRAQIFLSHREWKSTIIEQIPDERIVWRSEAAKGRVDGAVSFHALTPDLTRIMVVLQYYPQGFFEKVGNMWRAQGRRVRLELKHFQRHVMTQVALNPDEVEGWRGEIHDSEVTKPHEPEPEAEAAPEQDEARDEEPEEPEEPEEEAREEPPEEPQPKAPRKRQPARSGSGRRSREAEA